MTTRALNLADLFELVADTVPDRLALVAGTARRTYRELDERANRFAHALEDRGIPVGAHVGILAHNCAEWVEAMIGCYKARTVPVNLNFRYVAPELRYVIDNADLVALVYERALSPLVTEALAPDDTGAAVTPPRVLLVVEDGTDPSVGIGRPVVGFEEALAAASPDRGFDPRSPDDLYLLYTGGTTGMPKGVMWRQEDIFFAAMGGGGWGQEPITAADELAGRLQPDDAARAVMLIVGPADARQRPVGDVERLHDGRHRGHLHRPPLRPPRAVADRQRRGRGVGGPGGRRHGPADGRGAGHRGARHLRHVDPVRGGVGRGDAVGHRQGRAPEAAPRAP